MKKITVTIKDDTILFKYRRSKVTEPNLLNTNVISNDELVFSDEYIKENYKIIATFLSELIKGVSSRDPYIINPWIVLEIHIKTILNNYE